jgi:hypothetical protein
VKGATTIGALALLNGIAAAAELPADQIEFFEKRIRPVLIESCYKCHSTESGKAKGGLLLDTKTGVLQGGDSGPALVAGRPEDSLLIKAVRYVDKELQMPPESAGGKLAPEKVADLEAWVKMGAPDPRTAHAAAKAASDFPDIAKARAHWAFQPVTAPPVPAVKDRSWVRTPVDAFVLAKLEAKGIQPAPPADKQTLLRRLSFDLTGLPPSPQEMDDFLQDESRDAYEKAVDRLLASPRYGERWGRYWLDVARYADTKGYVFQEERRYAFSHTYRDYVIRAFNDDKPFDRFLLEQIAADQVLEQLKTPDRSALAALGFLTLGRRFLNNPHDIIDDRIDVVMRGTQGLTVTCARCHDHKFDPISAKDYYALHGVFASSEEPAEKPLLGTVRDQAAYDDYLRKKSEIEAKMEAVIQKEVDKFLAEQRAKSGDYLLAARDAKRLPKETKVETFAGERKVTLEILRRWMAFLDERAQGQDPVLGPWFAFAALPEKDFAASARDFVASLSANANADKRVNVRVIQAFTNATPGSLKNVAATYGKLLAEVDKAWTDARDQAKKTSAPPPVALPDKDLEALRVILFSETAPPNLPTAEARRVIDRHLDNLTVSHRQQIEALQWTHPGVPPRAMALVDKSKPRNSRVFIRGNPGHPGAEVPRRFLEVLAGPNPPPFTNGSGRLELAQAIASRDNPLTARVFVNRVWGWRFGAALVRTPSDFGVRTEAPVQRDLLDWLAATFMDRGWSVKQLHRLMLLSNTYRQSSNPDPQTAALDPDNRWLHHFNRRRLDFEAMRDTLLAASGQLDLTAGGLPVDLLQPPFSGRRTVYGFIDRQNLPGLFRTFDFANPDATSPQRFATTVPQQALFMMNSPFVVEQARALVARPELKAAGDDDAKLTALNRLVFQRPPAPDEAALARQFLQTRTTRAASEQPLWQYGSAQFDEATGHVTYFRRFTNYTAKSGWHPEKKFPGDQSGWVLINSTGGHPGAVPKLASVRRWTAPMAGVVTITGALKHSQKEGDGVRGRVVSSRAGLLGEWKAHNSSATTLVPRHEVSAGEVIDFLVDCVGSVDYDSYTWAPVLRYIEGDLAALPRAEFSAEREFAGPDQLSAPAPLSAWEQLAQVYLLSNELMFVD